MASRSDGPGGLTAVQYEILQAIRRLTRRNGHAPCMREVLSEVRLRSTSALSYQYRELSARGYLRWKAKQPRTVEVRLPGELPFSTERDHQEASGKPLGIAPEKVVWVPIVGRIAAGSPILAQEQGFVKVGVTVRE